MGPFLVSQIQNDERESEDRRGPAAASQVDLFLAAVYYLLAAVVCSVLFHRLLKLAGGPPHVRTCKEYLVAGISPAGLGYRGRRTSGTYVYGRTPKGAGPPAFNQRNGLLQCPDCDCHPRHVLIRCAAFITMLAGADCGRRQRVSDEGVHACVRVRAFDEPFERLNLASAHLPLLNVRLGVELFESILIRRREPSPDTSPSVGVRCAAVWYMPTGMATGGRESPRRKHAGDDFSAANCRQVLARPDLENRGRAPGRCASQVRSKYTSSKYLQYTQVGAFTTKPGSRHRYSGDFFTGENCIVAFLLLHFWLVSTPLESTDRKTLLHVLRFVVFSSRWPSTKAQPRAVVCLVFRSVLRGAALSTDRHLEPETRASPPACIPSAPACQPASLPASALPCNESFTVRPVAATRGSTAAQSSTAAEHKPLPAAPPTHTHASIQPSIPIRPSSQPTIHPFAVLPGDLLLEYRIFLRRSFLARPGAGLAATALVSSSLPVLSPPPVLFPALLRTWLDTPDFVLVRSPSWVPSCGVRNSSQPSLHVHGVSPARPAATPASCKYRCLDQSANTHETIPSRLCFASASSSLLSTWEIGPDSPRARAGTALDRPTVTSILQLVSPLILSINNALSFETLINSRTPRDGLRRVWPRLSILAHPFDL
ncbi:hypothetical protein RJ55_06259 [Drechmeria coniospora]|nr:hypothetical protein RJ55_06259 [Drechmeria coniospora]